ncbi:hypothetical protein HOLleu_29693 [Holothuria leucospilota]|uniref:Reverse transcriptase RNase H-like domain-containing protein n=1 Tax=Holothuria leucospilota TaxID=206669 RepID=A0A9Q1BJK8_HOLLE|nr:hypothetical protein HOLleu_29693 [Holothuria leucospilota]
MDKILQGIPNCLCKQDDVLIATPTVDENLKVLQQEFKRLSDYNVKLQRNTYAFVQSEVVYRGLKVSGNRLQPIRDKINPITNAPEPKNVGPKSAIPNMAASRLQRWAVLLSQYYYEIVYRSSKENAVADAFSRLPHEDSSDGTESEIFATDIVDSSFSVTAAEIAAETQKDFVLKQVYEHTLFGWAETMTMSEEFKPYFNRKYEL